MVPNAILLTKGSRNTTAKHMEHPGGPWLEKIFPTWICMDAEGPDHGTLPFLEGKVIQKNFVGKDHGRTTTLILVLSHFKGHPMGGYGGALKAAGHRHALPPTERHTSTAPGDPEKLWTADHDSFLASMADAASSVSGLLPGQRGVRQRDDEYVRGL